MKLLCWIGVHKYDLVEWFHQNKPGNRFVKKINWIFKCQRCGKVKR